MYELCNIEYKTKFTPLYACAFAWKYIALTYIGVAVVESSHMDKSFAVFRFRRKCDKAMQARTNNMIVNVFLKPHEPRARMEKLHNYTVMLR